MIPIRLWSVVVTQDVQPVRSGSTRRATICGTGAEGLLGGGGHEGGLGARLLLLDLLALLLAAAASAALMSALR